MLGVPNNVIIPFVGVEFDGSRANEGPAEVPINAVVVGQWLSSGTAYIESGGDPAKFIASTADEVAQKAGFGSMLHRQALKFFANNRSVPTTFLGISDAATAVAGTWVTDITGTVTAVGGELVLYIAGERFAVPALVGGLASAIGPAMAALINADTELQVTAAYATDTLTLTHRNKGVAAADLDVRFSYNQGEQVPTGLTVTAPVVGVAGATDPDIEDAIAVLGGEWYNVGTQPYTDNTNLNALEDYLDLVAGPMQMRDSVYYHALRASRAAMITFGDDIANRNSPWIAVVPAYKRLESTYEIAAAVAGQSAVSIQADPAVPLHRMYVKGVKVLDPNDTWTPIERNELAAAGIATLSDDRGVQTESTVTMYRQNSAGAVDTAYQMQNTPFILSALRYRFVNQILSKYPRAKLTNSADGIGAGQQIMTRGLGETEAVAWFTSAQRDGLVEGGQAALDQFIDELEVQRDASNRNRLNWLLPPDLINQFIVGSGVIQFRG